MLPYLKKHWSGFLLDALWIALVIGFGFLIRATVEHDYDDPTDHENHEILFLEGMSLILAAAPFWAQLRLTPRLVALADKRRREEMALTLIEPRAYLLQNIIWPFLPLLVLVFLISVVLTALHMDIFNEHYEYLEKLMPFRWMLLLLCVPAVFAAAISMTGTFVFFRWLCRSQKDPIWRLLVSAVSVVSGIFVFVWLLFINKLLTGSNLDAYDPSPFSSIMDFGFLTLCEIVVFCYLAHHNWRACCLNYFRFE